MRIRPPIIIAAVLMFLWVAAYWQLSQLSPELFQVSRTGPRAWALYLTGNYRDAARAYRAGLKGQLSLPYLYDPAGYWAFRTGDFDEAERRARTTLALVPSALEPQITLAELALERGKPTDAVALARAGDAGSAIQSLNRALRANSAGRRDTILYRIMELAGELRERPPGQRSLCLLSHLHRYLRSVHERQGLTAMRYAQEAITAG